MVVVAPQPNIYRMNFVDLDLRIKHEKEGLTPIEDLK